MSRHEALKDYLKREIARRRHNLRSGSVREVVQRIETFRTRLPGLVSRTTVGKRTRQQLANKDREIAALRRELTEARGAAASSNLSLGSTPVFFVVGHQKSGTTWLMEMLDAHPEILCRGEGRPFGRNFRQEHKKGRRRGYPPVSLYNAIASSEDLRSWIERSVWSKRDNVNEHHRNLTRLAIEYFLVHQLIRTDKRIVGDKTVLLSPQIMKEIGAIFPDARVIHIIRDGRDVAVSTMHHIWNQAEDRGGTTKATPAQLAKREAYRENPQKVLESEEGIFPDGWLADYAAQWSASVGKSVKDGPLSLGKGYAEVRYEDLLYRPEEEFGRLLEFLGADADESTVSRCIAAASFEKLSEGRKRGEEAASFYRKGIAGDWKNVFTEQNKQEFKAAAGDLLIELGYEKNNDW
jgi:Sulfotransferase domain